MWQRVMGSCCTSIRVEYRPMLISVIMYRQESLPTPKSHLIFGAGKSKAHKNTKRKHHEKPIFPSIVSHHFLSL